MTKIKNTIFLIFILLSEACSSSGLISPVPVDPLISNKITKSGEGGQSKDGTTFRFMLYDQVTKNYVLTGSYINDIEENKNYLTAASLDDNGNFVKYNQGAGLTGLTGTYSIIAVSPGMPIYESNGLTGVVTYPHKLDSEGNDNGAIYVSGLENKNIGEYNVIAFSTELQDHRSRIGFKVYKSEDNAETIDVTRITVSGLGRNTADAQVIYYPQTHQCSFLDENAQMEFTNFTKDSNDGFLTNPVYFISGIYGPKDIVASILKLSTDNPNILDQEYVSMSLDFKQGEKNISAKMMLNVDSALVEYKPMHEYIYTITIASKYIDLKLHIHNNSQSNNWDEVEGNGSSFEINDGEIINLGKYDISGWSENPSEEQIV